MGGDAEFQGFIRDFETTAIAAAITPETYNRAMAGIAPVAAIQQVIDNQPEFARQVWSYLDSRRIGRGAIANAKIMLSRYRDMLAGIEAKRACPRKYWWRSGAWKPIMAPARANINLFATLATLAYQGPRQQYARPRIPGGAENAAAAELSGFGNDVVLGGRLRPDPVHAHHFLSKYATDGDNDGKIDFWSSPADALASTATMFAAEGWQTGKPWGYEVNLPRDFDFSLADLDTRGPCRNGPRWAWKPPRALRFRREMTPLRSICRPARADRFSCCSTISPSS